MKYFFIVFFLLATPGFLNAQPPQGYYDNASGKFGIALQQALHDIIDNHNSVTYSALWTHFEETDKKTNGKVWDMYSDIPGGTPPYEFTFGSDQCGNYGGEGDCYNREHSWPKSWFGGEILPMYTDMYHLVPTDGYVNNKRDNYPFGEVGTASWTSQNGSKVGSSVTPGYSGVVFEPRDEYKGDFARSYFYMATRYFNEDSGWPGSDMTIGSQFKTWAKNMLLLWAAQDSVSAKEIERNNKVYTIQHNRNPYIDHPEFANAVWSPNAGLPKDVSIVALEVYPNPVSTEAHLALPTGISQQNMVFTVYSSTGMLMDVPVTLAKGMAIMAFGNLPPGLYLVQLSSRSYKTVYQARVIKKQ